MMEDAIRLIGEPASIHSGLYLTYGQPRLFGAVVPVYNLIFIAASLAIALSTVWLLTRTPSAGSSGDRRQPGDGRATRVTSLGLRQGLSRWNRAGHSRGRPRHSGHGRDERDGHRVDRRCLAVVVIGGSVDAGRVRRPSSSGLRSVPISVYPELEMLLVYLIVSWVLVMRRAASSAEPRVKGRLVVMAATAAVAVAPLVASTYHVLLMLPFMAYAVVLLGLNSSRVRRPRSYRPRPLRRDLPTREVPTSHGKIRS